MLLATRHKRTHRAALSPTSKAGTIFTYPEGIEGWVHLSELILRPSRESNPRPLDRKSDALTACATKTPYTFMLTFYSAVAPRGISIYNATIFAHYVNVIVTMLSMYKRLFPYEMIFDDIRRHAWCCCKLVYRLLIQFLADRTNGRAYATVLRLSVCRL